MNETKMRDESIPAALLSLLGHLPPRMRNEPTEVMMVNEEGESISVNDLVKRSIELIRIGIKHKGEPQ